MRSYRARFERKKAGAGLIEGTNEHLTSQIISTSETKILKTETRRREKPKCERGSWYRDDLAYECSWRQKEGRQAKTPCHMESLNLESFCPWAYSAQEPTKIKSVKWPY